MTRHTEEDGRDGAETGGDAWIERLLRADAARQPHVADDGFAQRVLAALPPPRRAAPAWIVPLSALLGGAFALGLTPAGDWLLHAMPALLELRHPALIQLVVLAPAVMVYALMFDAARER